MMQLRWSLLLALFSLSASAQDSWTLARVIRQSLDNNPSQKQAKEKVNEMNALVFRSRSELFATIDATLTAKTVKDAANSLMPQFGATAYNSYSFEVKATQPLIRWGLFSGVSGPKHEREAAEQDAEITERDLIANVIRAFYGLLLNQRHVENLQNIERIQKESLATAQQRQRSGRGQTLDVLQVRTQLALLKPKVAKALNEASLASAELATLMGDAKLKELRVTGKLDIVALKDIYKDVDFENFSLPEYKKIEARRESLEAQKSVAFGKNLPALNAIGTWGRSANRKSDLMDGYSTKWSYGLELSVPLFSGLSTLAERRYYAAQIAQVNYEQQNLRNTLSLAQVKGMQNLKLAQESINSSIEAFDLAESSLREAKRNFQYANIDFLQYLSVQEAYLEAASALDQEKFNYIDSLVKYFIASGQNVNRLAQLLEGQRS